MEELSNIIHISKTVATAKQLCEKLANIIPRQMFEIAIQGIVNGKVVARETLKAFRKDVTSKLVRFFLFILLYVYIFIIRFFLF